MKEIVLITGANGILAKQLAEATDEIAEQMTLEIDLES